MSFLSSCFRSSRTYLLCFYVLVGWLSINYLNFCHYFLIKSSYWLSEVWFSTTKALKAIIKFCILFLVFSWMSYQLIYILSYQWVVMAQPYCSKRLNHLVIIARFYCFKSSFRNQWVLRLRRLILGNNSLRVTQGPNSNLHMFPNRLDKNLSIIFIT